MADDDKLDPISEYAAKALAKDPQFQAKVAGRVAEMMEPGLRKDVVLLGMTAEKLSQRLQEHMKAGVLAEFRPLVARFISRELGERLSQVGQRMADRLLREETLLEDSLKRDEKAVEACAALLGAAKDLVDVTHRGEEPIGKVVVPFAKIQALKEAIKMWEEA